MIGQSFSPTDPNAPLQKPQGAISSDGGSSPLQQAIQILQLRLPHFFGGGAPAAAPLLQSQGAPVGFNPMALMQRLFGGQAGPGMAPSPMAPPQGPMGAPMGAPMGPMNRPMPGPPQSGSAPTPAVHYQPNPGGTAGPDPWWTQRPRPTPGANVRGRA